MYVTDVIVTYQVLPAKSGFIGSNLAKRLLSTVEGVKVVGLDNMNHYYDVRLKEARLNELEQFDNFSFVKGNLADKAVIDRLNMVMRCRKIAETLFLILRAHRL